MCSVVVCLVSELTRKFRAARRPRLPPSCTRPTGRSAMMLFDGLLHAVWLLLVADVHQLCHVAVLHSKLVSLTPTTTGSAM